MTSYKLPKSFDLAKQRLYPHKPAPGEGVSVSLCLSTNMAKVVVFGLLDFASLAHFYLKHDNEHEVVAFSVTKEYLPQDKVFEGLPIVAFEEVESIYTCSDNHFFIPMSHRRMNRLRQAVYDRVKAKGYRLISYISSKATVFPQAEFGENCFILEDNTIQPYTQIGNNVMLWSGNHLTDTNSYRLMAEKTGLKLDIEVGGNYYIDSIVDRYREVTRTEYLRILRESPLLLIKNALVNVLGSFSVGYAVGMPDAVNYGIALSGLVLLGLLVCLREYWMILAIGTSSIGFAPYFPPIQAYMFGSFILLSFVAAKIAFDDGGVSRVLRVLRSR